MSSNKVMIRFTSPLSNQFTSPLSNQFTSPFITKSVQLPLPSSYPGLKSNGS